MDIDEGASYSDADATKLCSRACPFEKPLSPFKLLLCTDTRKHLHTKDNMNYKVGRESSIDAIALFAV